MIDLYGLEEDDVRRNHPALYQHLFEKVKPQRARNRSETLRKRWWLHRRLRQDLRDSLSGLSRFIVTVETSKHRFFQFLDTEVLPDNKLIAIASDEAYVLGVLSSGTHVTWTLAAGSTLEDRPVYVKTTCFETFPFPDASDEQRDAIRQIAEDLDAHRKRVLREHEELTMTQLYNVLEKLRAGEELTDKERRVHELGLVSVLRSLHDDLDAAVAEAYGWPADLEDAEILERLVALNRERQAEEARGLVRWLRPDYQNPDGGAQLAMVPGEVKPEAAAPAAKVPWPDALTDRFQVVQRAVAASDGPLTLQEVNARFRGGRGRQDRVEAVLETLVALGQLRLTETGRYAT